MKLKHYNHHPYPMLEWHRSRCCYTFKGGLDSIWDYFPGKDGRKYAYRWVRDNRRIIEHRDDCCLVVKYKHTDTGTEVDAEIQDIS